MSQTLRGLTPTRSWASKAKIGFFRPLEYEAGDPSGADVTVNMVASERVDTAWRLAYRLGFPLARLWWRLRPVPHVGALVAIYVGDELLLLRSSYRREWNLPGGGVRPGETPEQAARRELHEEIGLAAEELPLAEVVSGIWDNRPDRVHIHELHLQRLPDLTLDHREIVAAELFSPGQLGSLSITGPAAAYLRRREAGRCS